MTFSGFCYFKLVPKFGFVKKLAPLIINFFILRNNGIQCFYIMIAHIAVFNFKIIFIFREQINKILYRLSGPFSIIFTQPLFEI